jgi:hypothetical protein
MFIIEPIERVLHFKRYEDAEIICLYTGGLPKPTINWLFNGKQLTGISNNITISNQSDPIDSNNGKYLMEYNILYIKNLTKQDSGIYTCILNNSYHPNQFYDYTMKIIG